MGEPVSSLREKIRELADDGKINVVLNLERGGLHRFDRAWAARNQLYDVEKSWRRSQNHKFE